MPHGWKPRSTTPRGIPVPAGGVRAARRSRQRGHTDEPPTDVRSAALGRRQQCPGRVQGVGASKEERNPKKNAPTSKPSSRTKARRLTGAPSAGEVSAAHRLGVKLWGEQLPRKVRVLVRRRDCCERTQRRVVQLQGRRRRRHARPDRLATSQAQPAETPRPSIIAAPFKWIDPTQIAKRQWLYRPHYIRQFLSLLFPAVVKAKVRC